MEKALQPKKRRNAMRDTLGDKVFYTINGIFLGLVALIVLYPLYFIVIASISNTDAVLAGEVVLLPKDITLDGYAKILAVELAVVAGFVDGRKIIEGVDLNMYIR